MILYFINIFQVQHFKKIFKNGCVSLGQIIDDEITKDMNWCGTRDKQNMNEMLLFKSVLYGNNFK